MQNEVRDSSFNILGYIETDTKGNKTVRDSHFVIVGYYNVERNVTQDSSFKIIGQGDIAIGQILKT